MSTMPYTPKVTGTGFRATVQRFGGYLAAMVMPNIGAFIAWGLITALFIPTGWLPNEDFAALVGPMITLLLPILIGYTGGRLVHGQRGAVVGAVATVGVVVGADVPMFLGAMIIGPLTAYILKLFDKLDRRQGQARLRDADRQLLRRHHRWRHGADRPVADRPDRRVVHRRGRDGGRLAGRATRCCRSRRSWSNRPRCCSSTTRSTTACSDRSASIEVAENGKSILFMIETNPGPGLGLLLAYLLLRAAVAAPHDAGRDDHPLPRRHPRDLLPVRADEAAPDPRDDRRRRRRRPHLPRHRRRPRRDPIAGQHLRLHGGHASGRPRRRAARHRHLGRA